MSTETVNELAGHFMAGRYDEAAAGLAALRPDLNESDLAIELGLAATKVLSQFYVALREAAERAADKLDAALLADPGPLSDYAAARDILRVALAANPASA